MAAPLPEFSEQEMAIIDAWLEMHWKPTARGCPICNNSSWNVNTKLGVAPCASADGKGSIYEVIPSVNINCNTCGYTIMFNAIKMGLWKAKEVLHTEIQPQSGDDDG